MKKLKYRSRIQGMSKTHICGLTLPLSKNFGLELLTTLFFLHSNVYFVMTTVLAREEGRSLPTDHSIAFQQMNEKSIAIDGRKCIIMEAKEGNQEVCQCPKGFALCNWQDAEHAAKLSIKPPWLRALCDNSSESGFKNFIVAVDYELQIICKQGATMQNPEYEYSAIGI
ncbi:sporozoite protein with an altered thrombospondin repeat SPATR, partial [Cardiosporidium cionae]